MGDFLTPNKFQALSTTTTPKGVRGGMSLPADEAQSAETPRRRHENAPEKTPVTNVDYESIFQCVPGSRQFQRMFPDIKTVDRDCTKQRVNLLEHEVAADGMLGAAVEEEKIDVKVAMDSGAVDNVIGKDDIPNCTEIDPNRSGRHFVGASGDRITNHGTCKTMMHDNASRRIGCQWRVADVSRPLHSVSRITGPEDGPGEHDVLFSNKRCVVVPPGVVEKVLQSIKPITEYQRKGGLYGADMSLSSFTRQGTVR